MDSYQSAFPPPFLASYQKGVMKYTYRDHLCLKSPIDLALYLRLLWKIKPATIIEIGSQRGGGALWFADMAAVYGLVAKVVSVDLASPALRDSRIEFLTGDVERLGDCLAPEYLATLLRPWFVVEDSSHTYSGVTAALEFFSTRMAQGEMIVIEDGILDELDIPDIYHGGPNRALADFMQAHPESFHIDRESCDFYGINATYSPNGFLIKS